MAPYMPKVIGIFQGISNFIILNILQFIFITPLAPFQQSTTADLETVEIALNILTWGIRWIMSNFDSLNSHLNPPYIVFYFAVIAMLQGIIIFRFYNWLRNKQISSSQPPSV